MEKLKNSMTKTTVSLSQIELTEAITNYINKNNPDLLINEKLVRKDINLSNDSIVHFEYDPSKDFINDE